MKLQYEMNFLQNCDICLKNLHHSADDIDRHSLYDSPEKIMEVVMIRMMRRYSFSRTTMVFGFVMLLMVAATVELFVLRSGMPGVTSARTRPQPPALTEAERVELAQMTLIKFFAELHDGNYDQAVQHFDGSFLVLQTLNPTDQDEDHAALLEDACEINGFLCLNVLEITSVEKVNDHTYEVGVVFQNEDGSAYSAETTNPFRFSVVEYDGEFFVQDLPIPPSS
jgi:hypothetical protein